MPHDDCPPPSKRASSMVDAQRVRQSILRAWEKKPIYLAAKPRSGSKPQGEGPVARLRKLLNQPVHDVASFLCVPSDLGDAAIDEQFNPSDVTRLNLCEKCNGFGDFVGISQPAKRNLFCELVFHLCWRRHTVA